MSAFHTTVYLTPSSAERAALDATLEAFVRASETAMRVGRQADTTSNALIHRLCYHRLRKQYTLSANLVVKAIAEAAKRLKMPAAQDVSPSVTYDARTLSFSDHGTLASLSTVHGRMRTIALHAPDDVRHVVQQGHLLRASLRREGDDRYALTLALRLDPPSGNDTR